MEAKPLGKPGRRLRAQELATQTIDKIIDPAVRSKSAPSAGTGLQKDRPNSAKIPSISRKRRGNDRRVQPAIDHPVHHHHDRCDGHQDCGTFH
jgi:hypothetical protein